MEHLYIFLYKATLHEMPKASTTFGHVDKSCTSFL